MTIDNIFHLDRNISEEILFVIIRTQNYTSLLENHMTFYYLK